eukprot:jgi/Tetstr1/459276/TSEL_004676.t1
MALLADEWTAVATQLQGAAGDSSWCGVLRGVCRAARDGASGEALEAGRRRMDPRVFTSRVELMEWAAEQGCQLLDRQEVVKAAVEGGSLAVLKWGVDSRGWVLPANKACEWAAESGHLEVLRWAREQGCPWDEAT